MTLYFMLAGKDPLPAQHLHADWDAMVHGASRRVPSSHWRSVAARFARMVLMATKDRQPERLDLGQIRGELNRLREVLLHPVASPAADLVAEEVAARAEAMVDYTWDQDRVEAAVHRPSGLTIRVAGEEAYSLIRVRLEWIAGGQEDWKRVGKWIPAAMQNAAAAIEKAGWRIESKECARGSMCIVATLATEHVLAALEGHAAALDRAAAALHFE